MKRKLRTGASNVQTGLCRARDLIGRRLGPKSIELGAAALDAMDAVALSVEAMIALHDELDHTMAVAS
jgi:DNA-binding IclR family transcriptional regulator